MSQAYGFERWRKIKFLFGLALIGAIISLVVFNYREGPANQISNRELVFKEFELGLLNKAARIRVTIPDSSFQIIKNEAGHWVMPERGNFPVSEEKLRRLETDIKYLYKLEHRTSDPSQFDRLGVGEPKEFGEGTTLEFFDNSGQLITGSSIGQIGNLVFVRKIGALEVYSAQGQLMDISKRANWLNFDFFKIPSSTISIVSVDKENSSNYKITRSENGRFRLSGGISGARVDEVAEFVSRFEPINVIESERIMVAPNLTQTILLQDKTILILSLHKQFGSFWVKIDGSNVPANSLLLPPNFSEMTKSWAFEIRDESADMLQLSREELGLRGALKNAEP